MDWNNWIAAIPLAMVWFALFLYLRSIEAKLARLSEEIGEKQA